MNFSVFIKRYPFLVAGLVCIVLASLVLLAPGVSDTKSSLSDTTYEYAGDMRFEVVDTPEDRELGLSGRTEVDHGYGMLFVFEEPGTPGFWMKDMQVPIDIIWLSDDGTILGIEGNVSPSTYPSVFYAPSPLRLVLETRAGYAKDAGWSVGDRIALPNFK